MTDGVHFHKKLCSTFKLAGQAYIHMGNNSPTFSADYLGSGLNLVVMLPICKLYDWELSACRSVDIFFLVVLYFNTITISYLSVEFSKVEFVFC